MNEFPRTLKIATVWCLAGLLLFLGFRALEAHQQRARFSQGGELIEIRRGPDGHYHWPGRVQGVAVDFLVDTGASRTALPRDLAERAGIELLAPVRSSTAGGLAEGHLARADLRLDGGFAAERLPVLVLPQLETPLLGMDLLGKLQISQQDGVLRIRPPGPRP